LQIPTTEESTKPFPYPLPLDPNTKTLASIPLALFYPGVVALAAAAGMFGNTVGRGLPGEHIVYAHLSISLRVCIGVIA
jgi:hypothetical protein